MNNKSSSIIYYRTEKNEGEKPPVPPAVEKITGNNYKRILNFKVMACCKPVKQKNYWKKNSKVNGIEEH